MLLESLQSATVERALSAVWQRAQLIANNLANEDTPGYKGKKLAFEGLLQEELRAVKSAKGLSRAQKVAAIGRAPSRIYDDPSLSVRADGNNVNLDNEHIELARAQMQYQALRDKINGHYKNLQYAISGGR